MHVFVVGRSTQSRSPNDGLPAIWLGSGPVWTPRRARPARLWLPWAGVAPRLLAIAPGRSCLERSPGRGTPPFQDRKHWSVPISWGPETLSWPPSGSLPIHHQHWWCVPSAPHLQTSYSDKRGSPHPPQPHPWEAGRIWNGGARLIPSNFHLTEGKSKKKKPSGFASAVSLRDEGLADPRPGNCGGLRR